MEWMNYHHLLYFWVVAREGSITRAAEVLNLTQPTISAQLQSLEDSLSEKLFERSGRKLALTEMGRVVFRYADEIFSLGRELRDVVRGRPASKLPKLVVGVADVVPKLVAFRLVQPAFRLPQPVEVILREDSPSRLLGQLAVHELDLVISDSPIAAGAGVKAYNHLLGESSVSFFGSADQAKALRKGFPKSLESVPTLLPATGAESRRTLDHFFERIDIRPHVVAEFEDSALMKIFGEAGMGVFPAPTAIAKEITSQYGVSLIGTIDEIRERYYVISPERKIKHPAVAAITESGRRLFE
jgi:LysR family transcriptional activator of nhaA